MRRGALALLCGSFVFAAIAHGDTVYLKNGRIIEGTVISEDDRVVVVELAGGVVRLSAGDILRIKRPPPGEKLATELRAMSRAGRGGEALNRLDKEVESLSKDRARALRVEILRAEAERLEKGLRLAEAYKTLFEAMTLAPRDAEVAKGVDRLGFPRKGASLRTRWPSSRRPSAWRPRAALSCHRSSPMPAAAWARRRSRPRTPPRQAGTSGRCARTPLSPRN
jgi:hypothetical protein